MVATRGRDLTMLLQQDDRAASASTLHLDLETQRGDFTLRIGLDVAPGQIFAVVGPNGSGKTTLLRVIAGLTPVSSGSVRLGSLVLDDAGTDTFVPVRERPVSVVFQDYRLFPHLSVLDNVAFAPRSAGASRADARDGAQRLLRQFRLADFAKRRPTQLSGGQAQRVALARALAATPHVLLLDEPLAALDAQTRLDVRGELRSQLAEFPGVCLLVTHDPLEALILADQLLVLENGRVTQLGAPAEVATRPATPYVASLVGLNLYRGVVTAPDAVRLDNAATLAAPTHDLTGDVLVTFRPSSVAVYLDQPRSGSPRNAWPAVVHNVELLSDRVRLQVEGTLSALADVTPAAVADLRLSKGSKVWLTVKSTEIDVYPSPQPLSALG
jgi:molybdate transport system ATP-binding protein